MDWIKDNLALLIFWVVISGVLFYGPLMAMIYRIPSISVHTLASRLGSNPPPLLIDVRTPAEYNAGHVPQAIPVPLAELPAQAERLRGQTAEREVAVICQSGNRSLRGAVKLRQLGFTNVTNVSGGFSMWRASGYPSKK